MIISEHPEANLVIKHLDLASLESIMKFAEEFKAEFSRLDILYNNAGLMAIPHMITEDGFEMQFGVNYLAHFALTGLLLDVLEKTSDSRIVSLSSVFHLIGKIRLDDLFFEKKYKKWPAYAQSKLANLMFTYELQRKLSKNGSTTIAVAAHPGYAKTHLQTRGSKLAGSKIREFFVNVINFILGRSASKGAEAQIYAGTDPNVSGGVFYGPSIIGIWGGPNRNWSTGLSKNVEKTLEDAFGECYKPARSLTKLFEEGNLGMKTGKGFYNYSKDDDEVVEEKIEGEFNILRILAPQLNEAFRLIDEGVATEEDIDSAVKLGTRVPKGPFELTKVFGADKILQTMRDLETKHGKCYTPSPSLVKLAEN